MNRDVAILRLNDLEELVIATDNSGSIGMREQDAVQVSYDVVAYYNFRVAWMECVAAGAKPFSIVLHNFSGDEAWYQLVKGIKRGMDELEITDIDITGSTETNFQLIQSAVGLVIIGQRKIEKEQIYLDNLDITKIKVAVIGEPLVGNEVIKNKGAVAPLSLFQNFTNQQDVLTLMPVGSKGILYELKQLFKGQRLKFTADLDLQKSSGPATSFIIVYKSELAKQVEEKAANWFHDVVVEQTFEKHHLD